MGAIDGGVIRQRRETLQAVKHLRCGTLEEAPAACGEEGVSAEKDVFPPIRDMIAGMAGYLQHRERLRIQRQATLGHGMGQSRNAPVRAVYGNTEILRQRFHASGVIGMMVGTENGARAERMFRAPVKDGFRATGVDNPRPFVRFGDVDIVIRKGRNKMNGHFCISLRARYHRPIMALNRGGGR